MTVNPIIIVSHKIQTVHSTDLL